MRGKSMKKWNKWVRRIEKNREGFVSGLYFIGGGSGKNTRTYV